MVYFQRPLLTAAPHAEDNAERTRWAWRSSVAQAGLLAWGMGVQLSEALAALGMALTLLAVLPPGPGWRGWPGGGEHRDATGVEDPGREPQPAAAQRRALEPGDGPRVRPFCRP